jgi:hypothetical protein
MNVSFARNIVLRNATLSAKLAHAIAEGFARPLRIVI